MHKVSKILILTISLALVFGLTNAQAKLVSIEPVNFVGVNLITDPPGANGKEEIFTDPQVPWVKIINVDQLSRSDSEGVATFQTTWQITNRTEIDWTDYHWEILEDLGTTPEETGNQIGNTFFGTPNNSNVFKVQSPTDAEIAGGLLTKTLDFQDGLVGKDEFANFTLNFQITGLTPNTNYDTYSLIIQQYPTNEAPPPGAPIPGSLLLLGSGLLGLVGLRWKL